MTMAASGADFIYALGMKEVTLDTDAYLALWDWRRAVFDAYRRVRDQPDDPVGAWRGWREARLALFNSHRQSPFGTGQGEAHVALPFSTTTPAFGSPPRSRRQRMTRGFSCRPATTEPPL